MKFSEVVAQTLAWLHRDGRVSYRALKREFDLDDEFLEDVKAELIEAKRVAMDENGKVLVWVGKEAKAESENRGNGETETRRANQDPQPPNVELRTSQSPTPNTQSPAERRQLTVLFCDLVGSTALSEQLDPEELREVVQAYQQTCARVIQRYEGHIAQYLGDGLLVYFGYPIAHEDDAQRAVRTGLEIVAALQKLVPSPWKGEGQGEGSTETQSNSPHPHPLPKGARESVAALPKGARGLQVRIGIHTGLVVIGDIGSSEKREILALGETPNIAARLQGLAEPDTVVISATTQRLVTGLFECQDLGPQSLKGVSTPLSVYQVMREGTAQSRFDAAVSKGLTPLVGREEELGLLRRRWEQAKTGAGQVVLLSGEPGIGKSRLVQTLKEHVISEGAARIEFRCSPYHQNSAFYPIIEHLQRLLRFEREDTPQTKLTKLQQALAQCRFPQADTLPLLATLLSLPQLEGGAPLTLSPQKQKQKTQEALVAWIVEEAEKAAVYCAWEDLHWLDPSSLEVLTLILDQAPTARLLVLLTFRPEFIPPWRPHSHIAQLTLNRLGEQQVREMVRHVAAQAVCASTGSARTGNTSLLDSDSVRPELVEGRATLSDDLIDAVIARTDGVPLFVEELTKSVIESVESIGSIESPSRLPLPFVIPATLQDSLMARLDRLNTAKEIAQLGAMLGREFSYELLHAVSPLDEESLQHGLRQLVETELIYQRGLPPQATYLFKHALIQDTAYQSLLKSKRQQLHQQIAQVLDERFPETVETQPELLARHYTKAGFVGQAIPYWQGAGERASQRSAYMEAIGHLTRGLELLKTLPDTPERAQQELTLQIALGAPLQTTKGMSALEVERVYKRARELCQQMGETPQLLPVLYGLRRFYTTRADYQTSLEIGEQFLKLAQRVEPMHLLGAHYTTELYWLGEFVSARAHLEEGIALYMGGRAVSAERGTPAATGKQIERLSHRVIESLQDCF
jgi:class 3 adenylate cyclase